MDKFQAFQKKYLAPIYPSRGLTLERGEGVYLFDIEGRRYFDLYSQYGVAILGYGHPALLETITRQAGRMLALHGSFAGPERALASRALVERAGGGLSNVFWCNSGTEAIEAALKFAVLATGCKRFIAFEGAYHGRSLGSLSATWGPHYREKFEPLLWDFVHLPYGDEAALAAALAEGPTAGVILEPIQGEGGLRTPPPGYLGAVSRLCVEAGALCLFDEVQTGCGRTGAFLASAAEVPTPDIVCLGKGLAGGLPVGATLVNEKVAASIPRGVHGSTFGGNPLVCAAALTVLELLDDDLLKQVRRVGEHLRARLAELSHADIIGVRGRGLMAGLALRQGRDELLKTLQAGGYLAIPAGSDVVRFLPPYLIGEEQVDEAVAALKKLLAAR